MKKKTRNKKNKISKKIHRKVSKKISHEIVVRVESQSPTIKDIAPIQSDGGKYMIPKTWLSEKQVIKMVQRTPSQHVYIRPGKGGQRWSYVTGNYVEKVLNFTFGWNWDFEAVSTEEKYGQVIVRGKLTVKDDKGHFITKMQTGRADIKFLKNTKTPLDYGNDEKAATTDALKKCASLLGIASDIYGKGEFKQETGMEVVEMDNSSTKTVKEPISDSSKPQELKKGQVIGPDGKPTYICSKCDAPISNQGAEISMKIHGKYLCREHYNEANKKK